MLNGGSKGKCSPKVVLRTPLPKSKIIPWDATKSLQKAKAFEENHKQNRGIRGMPPVCLLPGRGDAWAWQSLAAEGELAAIGFPFFPCAFPHASILLKLFSPLLALKGIHHYWKCECVYFFLGPYIPKWKPASFFSCVYIFLAVVMGRE